MTAAQGILVAIICAALAALIFLCYPKSPRRATVTLPKITDPEWIRQMSAGPVHITATVETTVTCAEGGKINDASTLVLHPGETAELRLKAPGVWLAVVKGRSQ